MRRRLRRGDLTTTYDPAVHAYRVEVYAPPAGVGRELEPRDRVAQRLAAAFGQPLSTRNAGLSSIPAHLRRYIVKP